MSNVHQLHDRDYGRIKKFFVDKGYGFIIPDNGADDVFIHVSKVPGNKALDIGTRVSYVLKRDAKTGKMSAGEVIVEG